MGGNRNRKEAKLRANCAHEAMLSTTTAGIERTVCEACGHLTMRHVAMACGPVDRAIFAREVDQLELAKESQVIDLTEPATTTVHPFGRVARESRVGMTVSGIVEELSSGSDEQTWRNAAGGRSAYRVVRTRKVPVGA